MTFCRSCLEIFADKTIPKVNGICPKVDCSGVLMEFDEIIAPEIWLLYSKGYRCVEYACSAHAHRLNSSMVQINFDDSVLIEDCPEGFKIGYTDEEIIVIGKEIESSDMLERQMEIFNAILMLRKWIETLDDCN